MTVADMTQRTFRTVVRSYNEKREKSNELSNSPATCSTQLQSISGISVDDMYSSECNNAIASSPKPSHFLGAGLGMLKVTWGLHRTCLPGDSRILPVKIRKVNCHLCWLPSRIHTP